MPRTPSPRLWSTYTLAGHRFQLLNLDHPEIASRVLGDLDAGIAVYYDNRWDLTTRFCRFLLAHPAWVAGRSVLVLGAGIGLETLVIGRLCTTLYVNDRAPGALELCAQQLRQNGITEFTCRAGLTRPLICRRLTSSSAVTWCTIGTRRLPCASSSLGTHRLCCCAMATS